MLSEMIEKSQQLAELYNRAALENPPSVERPWSLVIGFDEFAPGNKLKVDNRRKCMNLGFSFLELGQIALFHDWAWLTPVCILSSGIGKIRGRWSHFLRVYLRFQLLGVCGLSTSGVPLMLQWQPVMLFASLTSILSDGDGLGTALDWKGHVSLKPCFKHINVFRKDSILQLTSALCFHTFTLITKV